MATNTSKTYTDLRQFVVERLLALDPTLDDNAGSRMMVEVVEPLMNRLGTDPLSVDIEAFITQRLQDELPELDIQSPGSVLRDVLVTPMVLLLEPLRREIEYLRQQSSLGDTESLNEDEFDALLANVLATRKGGSFAYGTVYVYFSAQRVVGTDSSIVFTSASGVKFVPATAKVYTPADMLRSGNLWYIKVPVRSAEPTVTANVGRNEIRTVSNIDGVVRVTNPEATSGGITKETGAELLARSERTLTERTLTSERAIENVLHDNFSDIGSVEVVGFGDAAMERDVLRAELAAETVTSPGPTVYTTASFRTLPLAWAESEAVAPVFAGVPFTNILKLIAPPADKVVAIKAAKYMRMLDGNAAVFEDVLLSRLREVDSVVESGADLVVKLKDFVVYPAPASVGAATVTAGIRSGTSQWNAFPAQGTGYSLQGVNSADSIPYPIGAPLPVTDQVFFPDWSVPVTQAVFGRDYLLTVSAALHNAATTNTNINTGATADKPKLPRRIRCYPVDEVLSTAEVRLARTDAHLTSPRQYPYTGAATYAYQTTDGYTMLTERVEVVAFGAPAATKSDGTAADAATAYGGSRVDPWGKNPGVTLEATVAGADAAAVTCSIKSSSTQAKWADLGVQVGHFVSVALCTDVSAGVPTAQTEDFASKLVWQAWGYVTAIAADRTLTVRGLDWTPLFDNGGSFPTGVEVAGGVLKFTAVASTLYRLYWTVYKGQRQSVRPDGLLRTAFDDFAFCPNYLLASTSARRVSRRATTPFALKDTPEFLAGSTGDPAGTMEALCGGRPSGALSNKTTALWIRLQKKFTDLDTSIGTSPAEKALAVEMIDVKETSDTTDSVYTAGALTVTPTVHAKYAAERYDNEMSATIRAAYTTDVVPHLVSLPFSQGALASVAIRDQTAVPAVADLAFEFRNPYQAHGFLLPHPMGLDASTSWPGANALTGQLVQLYAEQATTAASDVKLTVTSIPGSVPFPGAAGVPITVNDNEVHVGGIIDVYVKPATATPATSGDISLVPDQLTDTASVVLTGTDGYLDSANPKFFKSAQLYTYLSTRFAFGANNVALDNLVVELVEPPTAAITPQTFRIVTNVDFGDVTYGVRVDGTFSGWAGIHTNLRFRVLETVQVDLLKPTVTYQQGTDLITRQSDLVVTIPSGMVFSADPAATTLYLSIESGDDQAEYLITNKFATTLALATAPAHSATGLSYRIYAKQAAGCTPPFSRVQRALLSGTGSVVPHRHPVDVVSTSVGGLSDDPVTDTDAGDLTLSVVSSKAVLTAADSKNFVTLGVLLYDSVRLDDVDDPNKYYYVTAFQNSGAGTNNRLVLDRNITLTSNVTTKDYVIGRPAVGSATVYFLDPTYLEVDQSTVMSFVDDKARTFKLRPSPNETAVVLAQTGHVTDAVVDGTRTKLTSATMGFLKAGVKIGMTVAVLSRMLTSAAFSAAQRADVQVAGKTLAFSVNDVRYNVQFGGTNPLTLSDVATKINQQLGALARAEEYTPDSVNYYLRLYCSQEMQIIDGESTPGLTTLLKLTDLDNQLPAGLVASYTISALTYDKATDADTITLSQALPAGSDTKIVFFTVKETAKQRLYPADLTLDSTGLYKGTVKISSYDPFTDDLIPKDAQLAMTGHRGLGYELVVKNTAYSYSTGEDTDLRVTSVFLDVAARYFTTVLVAPGAKVACDYDQVPTVADVQTYMLQPFVRTSCHNPLVRHFFPAYPLLALTYAGKADADDVRDAVSEFLATLYPNKPFEVFDLLARLPPLGVTGVTGPVEVGFVVYDKARKPTVVRSKDVAVIPKGSHVMGELDFVSIKRGG